MTLPATSKHQFVASLSVGDIQTSAQFQLRPRDLNELTSRWSGPRMTDGGQNTAQTYHSRSSTFPGRRPGPMEARSNLQQVIELKNDDIPRATYGIQRGCSELKLYVFSVTSSHKKIEGATLECPGSAHKPAQLCLTFFEKFFFTRAGIESRILSARVWSHMRMRHDSNSSKLNIPCRESPATLHVRFRSGNFKRRLEWYFAQTSSCHSCIYRE